MSTAATIGYGSKFAIKVPGDADFVFVAEVTNITPPSDSVDVVDATHMDSPNATREFILGLNDPGECSIEMNFIPGSAGDAKIQAVRASRVRVQCRITWPNGVTWTFDGIQTGYTPSAQTADKMSATVTYKVTGSYVTAPTAAPANTLLPAISGVAQVGQTLTAIPNTWTNSPAFTYQWKKNGANLAGATAATYVPVTGDIGGAITATVTGTNSAGNATATTAATTAVIA